MTDCVSVQDELRRLQEISAALASLEEHLRLWQQRLQLQADQQVGPFLRQANAAYFRPVGSEHSILGFLFHSP